MGELAAYILPAFGAVAGLVWIYIILVAWSPAARKRGGRWYLECIVLLGVPVMTTLTAMDANASLARPAALAAQAVTALVVALSIGSLARSLSDPRKGVGWLVFAIAFFYGALLLSAAFGVVPSLPPSYLTTPLVVLAFLCHGGYTYHWLLKTALVSLRITMVLSFVAMAVLPGLAFNTEESRTFFGIERLAGIAGHPNGLAALAALGLLLEIRSGSRRVWSLLFVAALLFAQSSTGYFVVIAGVLIMVLYSRPVLRWVLAAVILLFLAYLAVIPGGPDSFAAALGLGDRTTFNGRGRVWAAAMRGFDLSPIFGYGPELLGDHFRYVYIPGADFATHAHNQFVQTLASTGVIGIASLAVLLLTMLMFALGTMRRTGGVGLALLAFILLRSATETPLKPGSVGFGTMIVVLIVALLASAWNEREHDNPVDKMDATPDQGTLLHSPQVWNSLSGGQAGRW